MTRERVIHIIASFVLIAVALISYQQSTQTHYEKYSKILNATSQLERVNIELYGQMESYNYLATIDWGIGNQLISEDRSNITFIHSEISLSNDQRLKEPFKAIYSDSAEFYTQFERYKSYAATNSISKEYLPSIFFRVLTALDQNRKLAKGPAKETVQNLMTDMNLFMTTRKASLAEQVATLNSILFDNIIEWELKSLSDDIKRLNFHINQVLTNTQYLIYLSQHMKEINRAPNIRLFTQSIHHKLAEEKERLSRFKISFYIASFLLLIYAAYFIFMFELTTKLHRDRMADELLTAQAVQETLFPPPLASIDNVHIAGFYQPASECGGDWWFYHQTPGKIFFWIGDATGHGVSAALVTAAARSCAAIIEERSITSPAEILRLLNRSIYDTSKGKMMMTFFVGHLEIDSNTFTYANACHEPPIVIGPNTSRWDQLLFLDEVNGSRLGQDLDSKYQETTVKISARSRLFFYTDGLTELTTTNGNNLGLKRMLRLVTKLNLTHSINQLPQALFEQLERFGDELAFKEDDLTYFFVEIE
jgi:serine phosphatase RsbU (regulator of sigma subunit)